MKYRIALDCDDVLNNLHEVVCKVFNEENGTDLTEDTVLKKYDVCLIEK